VGNSHIRRDDSSSKQQTGTLVRDYIRSKSMNPFHGRHIKTALLGSVAFSFLAAAYISPAQSAEFTLLSGEQLLGEVSKSSQNEFEVDTSDGPKTITRAELSTITIETSDGELISGSLRYWFNGVYELQTERGSVRLLDGTLIADNREPEPEPEPIEEKPLTEEEQRALIMAIFSAPVIDTNSSDPIIALMRVPTSPEAIESVDVSRDVASSGTAHNANFAKTCECS